MLTTFEVRWFYTGPLPEAIQEWFEYFEPADQPPRTDYYLNMKDSAGVSIKLREGSIQIKPEKENFGVHSFLKDVGGVVKHYEKWSFPVTSNAEWAEMIRKPDIWVPVNKIRKLLRFTLEGGFPDSIGKEEQPDEGCEVELSKVDVVDESYWSLAFEAHGSDAKGNLGKTINELFHNKSCPVPLSEENSFGYTRLISDIHE